MKVEKSTRKYLERHAERRFFEPIGAIVAEQIFQHAIVVPCRAEGANIQHLIASISGDLQNILLIMVINGSRNDSVEQQQLNHESWNFIKTHFNSRYIGDEGFEVFDAKFGTIVALNCFDGENTLGPREGVGLARKIGSDLALYLWTRNQISSPFIQSTDADVRLPSDLLEQVYSVPRKPKFSALLLPFLHVPTPGTPEVSRASAIYEISLRYYVMGLRYAGSPYAYHTIGSTILVHANDYAKVHGYPKRLAGEDFYLLNKLRKVRPIYRCAGEPLRIEGRISRRVPFGTGRKIEEIQDQSSYGFYSPKVFEILRIFLNSIKEFTEEPEQKALRFDDSQKPMIECLETLGYLPGIMTALNQEGAPELRAQRFMTYFDALKTLRTVHALRDAHFPNIDYQEALEGAAFIAQWSSPETEPEKARAALASFEESYFQTIASNHS